MDAMIVKNETAVIANHETRALIRSSLSENTLKAYRQALLPLTEWLNGQTLTEELLVQYLTEQYEKGLSPSTISMTVSAVKWRAGDNHVVGALTKTLLKGIRKKGKDRGRGQVDPLRRTDIDKICAIAHTDNNKALALRDIAIIRIMSDALLRIGELVNLNVEDLKENAVHIRESKADQTGEGVHLFVTTETMKAIEAYLNHTGIEEGALFRGTKWKDPNQNRRINRNTVRALLKQRAKDAGIDGFISGHSPRVGMAVSLARVGAGEVEMQRAGRWKSSLMPNHYASAELSTRGAVAQYFE